MKNEETENGIKEKKQIQNKEIENKQKDEREKEIETKIGDEEIENKAIGKKKKKNKKKKMNVIETCAPYQFFLSWLQSYIKSITVEKSAHELEVLHGELVLVVHELDVLFPHQILYRGRHLHQRTLIGCKESKTGM